MSWQMAQVSSLTSTGEEREVEGGGEEEDEAEG